MYHILQNYKETASTRITFKVKFLSIFIQNIYLRGGETWKEITLKNYSLI